MRTVEFIFHSILVIIPAIAQLTKWMRTSPQKQSEGVGQDATAKILLIDPYFPLGNQSKDGGHFIACQCELSPESIFFVDVCLETKNRNGNYCTSEDVRYSAMEKALLPHPDVKLSIVKKTASVNSSGAIYTLTLAFPATVHFYRSRCRFSPQDDRKKTIVSAPITYRLTLPEPVLSPRYHAPPNIVYSMLPFEVTCVVAQGTEDDQHYRVYVTRTAAESDHHQGGRQEWALEDTDQSPSEQWYRMSTTSVLYDDSRPYPDNRRLVNISATLDGDWNASRFHCDCHDGQQVHQASTRSLLITYQMGRPTLSVIQEPDVTTTHCSALVGSGGVLTWGVYVDNSTRQVIHVDTLGKVWESPPTGISIVAKNASVQTNKKFGPFMEAIVKLERSDETDGAFFLCSSHKVLLHELYPADHNLKHDNYTVVRKNIQLMYMHDGGPPGVLPGLWAFYILGLLLGGLAFYAAWVPRHESRDNLRHSRLVNLLKESRMGAAQNTTI